MQAIISSLSDLVGEACHTPPQTLEGYEAEASPRASVCTSLCAVPARIVVLLQPFSARQPAILAARQSRGHQGPYPCGTCRQRPARKQAHAAQAPQSPAAVSDRVLQVSCVGWDCAGELLASGDGGEALIW